MSKNILVVSVDIRETRVALIEDGIIAELHLERSGHSSSVGNVVLGRVTRVLPGLQAAFIDIGQERAAFLHVEDLIRPDDFDTYLAGGKKQARDKSEDVVEATGDEELDAEVEVTISTRAPADAAEGAVADASLPLIPNLPSAPALESALESDGVLVTSELTGEGETDDDSEALDVGEAADTDSSDSSGGALDDSGAVLASDDEDEEEHEEADEEEDDDPSDPAIAAGAPSASGDLPIAETTSELIEAVVEEAALSAGLDPVVAADLRTKGAHSAHPHPAADVPDDERATIPDDMRKSAEPAAPKRRREAAPAEDLDFPGMPGFTISNPGEVSARAVPAPRADRAGERGGDRGRGRQGRRGAGRGRSSGGREARTDTRTDARPDSGARPGGGRDERPPRDSRDGRSGDRSGRSRSIVPGRISKSTPIREVVKEGQDIIVQVSKDPIGTKGARCTSHVSLPGRYVVYLPTVDHIGISKRIGSEKERARLRDAIESMKPPTGGLIVRTVAEGLTKKGLKQDVGYLVRLWGEIAKKKDSARSPSLLASELDLVLKTARDLFTDEVHQIVIDDKHQYDRLCRFVEMFAPDRVKDIVYYSGDEPIFDAYGIEDEIQRALSRKVPLPSGGHLVIDQAEALTAIDVNTGRFVGKGSKDMEETILKTNLEAVHEIAYQLRFRNIGGLIILDLIDMERSSSREKVRRALEDLLQKDKAKTTLNRISDLGLIEMTRKRTRESLGRLLHEPCFYCDGTGQLQSKETIAYEILREIRRKRSDLPGYTVQVNVHPAVADLLLGSEKAAVADAENRYMRKINVVARKEYHLEQFDLIGK